MTLVRCLVVLAVLLASRPAAGADRQTIPAVLHVHSTLSTGRLTLDQLAEIAAAHSVGALFLAENYLLRVDYGVPPFRALTRVSREERSVLGTGVARYLERVAEAQRRFPGVLLVPGVEVVPHYYWEGSPVSLDMTVRNIQKNIVVFGVTDPAALGRLPSVGNPRAGHYSWQSLLDAVPALLVVPGVLLLLTKRIHRVKVGQATMIIRRRPWGRSAVLLALGAVALIRGWPFTTDRYPTWSDPGIAPHQELIDYVDRLGGVTIWSFPEARDEHEERVGPIRVSRQTEPYPDDLLRSSRYTAFGAVYEDTSRFELPGEGWDRLLRQYADGERSRPVWAVGESGFHDFEAGKRIGTLQTVFLASEKTQAGVLDALKRGRMYALQRTPEVGLELRDFSVVASDRLAGSGEILRLPGGAAVEVRLAISASGGASEPVRVSLIRNGAAVETWTARTPFTAVHREMFDGRPVVFRIDVRGTLPHRLLSNPIFLVRP